MKNKIYAFMGVLVFALLIVASLLSSSCKSVTPLTDALGNTLSTSDIQTYGLMIGETGYYVFKYYENNPKYSKQIERCKEIYAALEKAKNEGGRDGLDLAAVNDATCEIITLAATAKLGPANGALVGAGARAALMLGYQFYKSRMKESQLEIYLNAVWKGIENAKANGADLIPQKTEVDELVALQPSEECGIECCIYKVEHKLEDKTLSDYDRKRLKKHLDELNELYQQMVKEIEEEFKAEGLR